MLLPLHNPHHFLYGKSFTEQCRLVLASNNVYDLFGLAQSASKKEITRAYWHLARHFHPDHHQAEQELASQAMVKIIAAKEYLDSPDPQSRSNDLNTYFSLAGQRILSEINEAITNSPPRLNTAVPLAEATDFDLLCRVYWQRLENDAGNTGMQMSLNQDLIAEIKSRIETQKSFGVFTEKLPPHGNTLLQLVARSKEVELFKWLLEHAPDLSSVLDAQDNAGQTCIYHVLINLNPVARLDIFNLIATKIDLSSLQENFDYILRTTYVSQEVLRIIARYLPENYFSDNAVSIATENPLFFVHLTQFVAPDIKESLIKEALQKNSANYSNLAKEDRADFVYIILTFLQPEGRSQANVDALPLRDLPISFIAALTIVWPDLKDKLASTITGYTLENNDNLYGEIKNSWAYKLGEAEAMYTLLAVNFILVTATIFLCLSPLPTLAILFALATTLTLLMQVYSLYQLNDTHRQVDKIRFFQDEAPKVSPEGLLEVVPVLN